MFEFFVSWTLYDITELLKIYKLENLFENETFVKTLHMVIWNLFEHTASSIKNVRTLKVLNLTT